MKFAVTWTADSATTRAWGEPHLPMFIFIVAK